MSSELGSVGGGEARIEGSGLRRERFDLRREARGIGIELGEPALEGGHIGRRIDPRRGKRRRRR